jgi:hypothetical protein
MPVTTKVKRKRASRKKKSKPPKITGVGVGSKVVQIEDGHTGVVRWIGTMAGGSEPVAEVLWDKTGDTSTEWLSQLAEIGQVVREKLSS